MIAAIETKYNGYNFRSRLEARWAVFFNALDVDWEYEKEGFKTPYGYYLPDFFISNSGWFIEIKGVPPSEVDKNKSIFLDNYPPEYAHACTTCIGVPKFDMPFVYYVLGIEPDVTEVKRAIERALSARFEHGESS